MGALTLDLVREQAQGPLFERLSSLGLPGNKTEQYRHFAIKPLLARDYTLKTAAVHTPKTGERLVIENGVVTEIPAGCSVSYRSPFTADPDHYDALYFLSHLLAPAVIALEISEDAGFELRHIVSDARALLPYRLSVTVTPGKHAELFETFEGEASAESLVLYGIDAEIGDGAVLLWIRDESGTAEETALIGTHRFHVGANGSLELKTFDFGTAQALHLYKIDLESHARCDAGHLLMASGTARRGNVVHINHNAPHATCVQEARSVLRGAATGIFDGLIRVDAKARYADARQNTKAVLLSPQAYMYAKPQLEIYTDELEASHGATIGQLDEDALFYLRSRGIAEEEARRMLVLAFAEALIDSVGDSAYAERIRADFQSAYFTAPAATKEIP
ncbi:SufD family Fe-S cluster assembly protein [Sulfurimonas sp. HSL1-2]|uniref:SufD family Fe-S cluster assembly protein n=1 Tax=Thiomicrolovo zhangzhouensis TaxID=3131933 RepID=UPI0031F8ADBF